MQPLRKVRLGVNLDHVVTLRQARHTSYPSLSDAIEIAEHAGADGITMHLREDRRHIQDHDVFTAKDVIKTSMNLEMAATEEMQKIAQQVLPHHCCIVPERREELTTEGGLKVIGQKGKLRELVVTLSEAGINVSFFIEPDVKTIDACIEIGVRTIELHTGSYAEADTSAQVQYLKRIQDAALYAHRNNIIVNAGHGLHYTNVQAIAGIKVIRELNIGHAIVARAVMVGLHGAVTEMRKAIDEGIHQWS